MKLHILHDTSEKIGEAIVSKLISEASSHPKVALFLSGGSLIASYDLLLDFVKGRRGDELVLGLVDERYSLDMNDPNSNLYQIKTQTKLVQTAQDQGIHFLKVLTGNSAEVETESYNRELARIFNDDFFKIALLGIGPDGHTAGMLPNENRLEFQKLFFTEQLVTHYPSADQYAHRITMTPKALVSLDYAFVYAVGENKKNALRDLMTQEGAEHMYRIPSVVLKMISQCELFTDQDLV